MDSHERPSAPQREEAILAFWNEREVFRHSVERDAPQGEFVFFEGPPTANAPPGIHHVAARTFKDVIPRYKTMRGFRVRRKPGWDTHGLPVELQTEKALGLKTKREVEAYGVASFNAQCRDSVWEFKQEWERLTDRIGFWLDQRDPYVTYEMSYVESVWWFLRQAWEQQLLVRDHKIVPWCPRCETPLSSHEVALGYDEVEDPSVFVQFALTDDSAARLGVQSEHTFFLVWTTTPWTLPGNGALAVHPEGEYVVVRYRDAYLILARPLVERVCGDDAEIVRIMRGSDLAGLQYEPLYPRADAGDDPKMYAVVAAPFVSFDDGTGIVHIAPTYGEDDFVLGKQYGIPLRFSVDEHGIMGAGLPGAGKFAKQADVDIMEDLRQRKVCFRGDTIRHTYPFCWRCKTPLLYFARASWYITMSKLRDALQERNAQIAWHPAHIGAGRMGEWLREAKDWAITRERSWGTPLPIWECTGCQRREILGSFKELLSRAPKRNRFIVMRHGEAESNIRGVISTQEATSTQYPMTARGEQQVRAAAEQLRDVGITRIVVSSLHRTRQTAAIVAEVLRLADDAVTSDARLREIDLPDFDGKSIDEHRTYVPTTLDVFTKKIGTNETWDELARRMVFAFRDLDAMHEGETILVISHGDPLLLLTWALSGNTRSGVDVLPYTKFADPQELLFTGALVNDRGEFDVHRPFVDTLTWRCGAAGCSGTMQRFPEVVDVWMDSGCMPFAQHHYPFEWREHENALPYPASYICEAIDQTRGWFYTLLAVATVLNRPAPYEHCVVLGHLLDKEGKKMSKSQGNVVDPNEVIATYGADVVRWYMLTVNQPWDSKLFDEADLQRMSRKPFGTLMNVLEFWKLHGGNAKAKWIVGSSPPSHGDEGGQGRGRSNDSGVLLDSWLRARFASLHHDVTQHLDAYQITDAARALEDAIDDLSTWWLRRSRDRLKDGDASARATFTAALETLAVLLAPFAPFTAEYVWQALRVSSPSSPHPRGEEGEGEERWSVSVHLGMWDAFAPSGSAHDDPLRSHDDAMRTKMGTTRAAVHLVLEARAAENVPVRQPLAHVSLSAKYRDAYTAMIADETNVKRVTVDPSLDTDAVHLDTALTPELQREGMARELIRKINGLRKAMGLTPSDRIRVAYSTTDAVLAQAMEEHRGEIERGTMSVRSPSSGGGVGGGAEAEGSHHPLTISGLPLTIDIAREV